MSFPFNYSAIPEYMRPGLLRYINEGVPVGSFLTAILEGDLFEAASLADDQNIKILPIYTAWLINRAPSGCFRSPEVVSNWVKSGGLSGLDTTFTLPEDIFNDCF